MPHFKEEKTLVIIKPDGVQRSLVGEIIKRYERMGLKLMGMKMLVPSEIRVEKHYMVNPDFKKNVGEKALKAYEKQGKEAPSSDPEVLGQKVLDALKVFMTASPVIAMVWQGAHAVEVVRKITGGTEPRSSDVGTIRGDFVLDSYAMSDADSRAIRNLIHASGDVAEAEKEIPIWFEEGELVKYRLIQDRILYDVNLDGFLE